MSNRRMIRALAPAIACAALLLAGCSQESADWKQASVANTPEAYQLFLQQHPHAAEAAQAQTRLQQLTEQRDWQIASTTDTRDGYQQFVARHPESKWVQEARIRIENFAQSGVSGGAALAAATASAAPVAPAAGSAAAPSSAAAAPHATVAASNAPAAAAPATASPAGTTQATARVSATHAAARGSVARRTHAGTLARSHGSAHASSRLVQLGAFRSKASAESEWRQLEARFHTLKTLTPRYVAVRSRGARVYRLQVRLSSSQAASGLCATLRRHARPCVRINA